MSFQPRLWQVPGLHGDYGEASSAHNKSLPMHRWSNWIAGFSGEFARSAIAQFMSDLNLKRTNADGQECVVLDPFAGVGTTLVEAKRAGLRSVGFEINPFAALVCRVKLGASNISLDDLKDCVKGYEDFMTGASWREPLSSPPSGFKSRIPFFSPSIERKVLLTMDYVNDLPPQIRELFLVAFASVIVDFSNYSYEPSLGTRPGAGKSLIDQAEVSEILSKKLHDMMVDIVELQWNSGSPLEDDCGGANLSWTVYERSFFDAGSCIAGDSVDLVVTSPPYMNNYHYVRNSRPQLFWTGLIQATSELKILETDNFGKFWQTVRGERAIPLVPEIPRLVEEIDQIRRINCGRRVYGGAGWANYVSAYMNDIDRFCGLLSTILKPGGSAVVVVGNSIVQGREIKVEEYLAEIAEAKGLAALSIVRLRERVGTSIVNTGTRMQSGHKPVLYDAAVAISRVG